MLAACSLHLTPSRISYSFVYHACLHITLDRYIMFTCIVHLHGLESYLVGIPSDTKM